MIRAQRAKRRRQPLPEPNETDLTAPGPLPSAVVRDRTLDAFRGATVAAMILVNNPGSWQHLYAPLAHAVWHGWTPTDLVFPFFLFAVGNALALTLPAQASPATDHFGTKWLRRTLLIFGIGLLLNAWPFLKWDIDGVLRLKDFEALRIMGVLQRIALCWAVAALVVRFSGLRGAAITAAALLVAYPILCLLFAQGNDPWSLEGFFGTALDRQLLGEAHLYRGEGVPFDPEGLASTIPAIAQVLIGYLVGTALLRHRDDPALARWLLLAATLAVTAALAAQGLVPINKKLWTSTYVLLSSGLAVVAILALRLIVLQFVPRQWIAAAPIRTCEAFGRNALFIFALSGLLPRTLALIRLEDGVDAAGEPRWVTLLPWLYRTCFEPLAADPRTGSLLFAIANLVFYWVITREMDRRRWYIKV